MGAGGYTDNAGMTVESCISYCASKGYQYAGVQWYQECYCDSGRAPASKQTLDADCNTPCRGNSSESCGGGNRLSIYYSSAPVGPLPNPGVNNYTHVGCYAEGTTGRALTNGIGSIPGDQMTVAKCTAACRAANFLLAGVEYSGQCCESSRCLDEEE